MKDHLISALLSIGLFIGLLLVDTLLYDNLMRTTVLISLIVSHYFSFMIFKNTKKKLPYILYLTLFLTFGILCLPNNTEPAVRNHLEQQYNVEVIDQSHIPIDINPWNLFTPNHAIIYETRNGTGEIKRYFANLETKELIKIDDSVISYP